jgi:hypothetical protein
MSSNFERALQRQMINDRAAAIEELTNLRAENIRELLRRARDTNNLYEAAQSLELAEINSADERRVRNLHRLWRREL